MRLIRTYHDCCHQQQCADYGHTSNVSHTDKLLLSTTILPSSATMTPSATCSHLHQQSVSVGILSASTTMRVLPTHCHHQQ